MPPAVHGASRFHLMFPAPLGDLGSAVGHHESRPPPPPDPCVVGENAKSGSDWAVLGSYWDHTGSLHTVQVVSSCDLLTNGASLDPTAFRGECCSCCLGKRTHCCCRSPARSCFFWCGLCSSPSSPSIPSASSPEFAIQPFHPFPSGQSRHPLALPEPAPLRSLLPVGASPGPGVSRCIPVYPGVSQCMPVSQSIPACPSPCRSLPGSRCPFPHPAPPAPGAAAGRPPRCCRGSGASSAGAGARPPLREKLLTQLLLPPERGYGEPDGTPWNPHSWELGPTRIPFPSSGTLCIPLSCTDTAPHPLARGSSSPSPRIPFPHARGAPEPHSRPARGTSPPGLPFLGNPGWARGSPAALRLMITRRKGRAQQRAREGDWE
ncbi:MAPK-interacting and spindle-stabilizing protein-like isoform X2 [Chamaea fasciata]|uniref:MAPK-interacting and spindle-stabilizing protein-like isoform X2 n=1 Tax=Chamaea fasciata TaxID=190680 RepID=UPI003369C3D6